MTPAQQAAIDAAREAYNFAHAFLMLLDETAADHVVDAAIVAERSTWAAFIAISQDMGVM